MQIDKLKYFLEVVRTESINQAAQNLHISHQALNQSIRLMEKELNVKLLDGNRKGSRLTAQGEVVKQTAETILTGWTSMLRTLHKEEQDINVLRIGCIPYYEWLFYELYAYAKEDYPHIRLEMQTVSCKEALEFLSTEQIDVAFVAMREDEKGHLLETHETLIYDELKEESYELCVNLQSPLVQKEKLLWSDLQDTAIVFHKQWDSDCNQMVHFLKEQGCNNILYVYSEDTIHKAVEENLACQIVSSEEILPQSTKVKTKVIKMVDELSVSYGILYRAEQQNNLILSSILKYAKSSCKK